MLLIAAAIFTTVAAAIAATATGIHRAEVFRSRFAHFYDLPFEIERLACHRMIEIHRHDVIFHVFDYAYQTITLVVTHRKLVAYLEQAVFNLAVDHEHLFGQVYHRFADHRTIGIVGIEMESELIALA